jgi:hypothetical protein
MTLFFSIFLSPKISNKKNTLSQLCTIFNVPIAIVSLVDTERQWFKSICGLLATETDRRSSFCAWTLLPPHPEVLVVPDAREDARFADNPLVEGEPKIRFYAGAPLVASNGARLGSLCVIDTVPRSIDAEQCNVLVNFAEVVMREVEKEKTRLLEAARLRSSATDLLRVIDGFRECVMLADASGDRWPVLFVNDACARGAGVDPGADAGRDFWEMFALAGPEGKAPTPVPAPSASNSPAAVLVARVAAREAFHVELVRLPRRRSGGGGGGPSPPQSFASLTPRPAARFAAHFRPASSAHLDGAPAIGIPTVASSHSLGIGTEGRGSSADALYFITVGRRVFSSFFSCWARSRFLVSSFLWLCPLFLVCVIRFASPHLASPRLAFALLRPALLLFASPRCAFLFASPRCAFLFASPRCVFLFAAPRSVVCLVGFKPINARALSKTSNTSKTKCSSALLAGASTARSPRPARPLLLPRPRARDTVVPAAPGAPRPPRPRPPRPRSRSRKQPARSRRRCLPAQTFSATTPLSRRTPALLLLPPLPLSPPPSLGT